jgi:glycosyltransferase involved in cell wall biosynthesis
MYVLHIDEQTGWRGGEQQASWLLQGLVKRGHRVAVAGRPGSAFLTSPHGGCAVEHIALPFRGEWDLATAWQLAREVRSRSVDILHAHSSHAHTMAVLARMLARRGKVVVSRRVGFAPRAHLFNRWKYRQPDRILAVSEMVGQVLREFGVTEPRLAVVHSSVDLERLEVPPLPRAELDVPDSAPLLVSAGALVGHKDHETLINAMPLVARAFPDVRLLVAGEGALRPQLEAQIAALGLQQAVRLLGHRTDVPRLIRAADVYVSSSWSEGLGTSVLEALACGTPVAATVAGGVPEMVKPGVTGHLVPNRDPEALAEAIIASLRNREAAHAMAARGRKLVETRFTTERMIEGTLREYESLG